MNQQKLREWIMKQPYFTLEPKYDGMTAWELAGIIIREGSETEKVIAGVDFSDSLNALDQITI